MMSLNFVTQNLWKITTALLFIVVLAKGCTNQKISNLDKKYDESTSRLEHKIDSLQTKINTMPTSKQVRDEMEVTMFNYLIYEDDLDKGKSSLSDVKNKIESND